MAKKFERAIEQAFGLSEKTVLIETANTLPVESDQTTDLIPIPETNQDTQLQEDFAQVRRNLKSLANTAQDVVDIYQSVAEDIETPRAYEVLGKLIRDAAEINEKILTSHVALRETENISADGPKVVNQTLVLTSEELQRKLKKKK